MEAIEAAETVIETITQMATEGRPLMMRVLPEGDVHWWAHYPDKDARDAKTKSRWYYHMHAPGNRDASEHGHFHLFLHRTQMEEGLSTIAQPPEGENAKAFVTHITGLSINRQGLPTSWFATNRWVTNEFMYSAPDMIAHLDRYNVDQTKQDETVNRFLTAMVALYRDEISDMLLERDQALADLSAAQDGDPKLYEKGNEVLAVRPIDLDQKIESLGIE